jgi:hypothetical protein
VTYELMETGWRHPAPGGVHSVDAQTSMTRG